MKKHWIAGALVLMLALPSVSGAAPITLTFDELPTQPVNGLSFMGVTFGFQVGGLPSGDARYNAEGPGDFTFIQGRVLEGDAAGILTLDFPEPTPFLAFGIALSTLNAVMPGVTIQLFDTAQQSLGIFPVNTSPLILISENQFSFEGALISRAVLDFNENFTPIVPGIHRFALDNLNFEPIPEPASLLLLGSGLVAISTKLHRRRRRT
jgi:hypothetical protein